MRKIILIIATVIFLADISKAQDSQTDLREDLLIGPKIGGNISNVYDSKGGEFTADPKFGLVAGGFISIPIGKYLGIQPEVLFSQKGFKTTGTMLGNSYEYTHTTDYLDIPLLVALKPVKVLTLLAGPQYSFLMKQTNVFKNSFLTDVQEQEFKNDNIRKNTLCITGGFDINLSLIVIGARIGWDIQNNKGDGTSTDPRYKNVWYQATVGIRF